MKESYIKIENTNKLGKILLIKRLKEKGYNIKQKQVAGCLSLICTKENESHVGYIERANQ